MDIKNLVPVEWQNRRVLTSAQIAEAYKCSVDQIKVNFNANKNHYKEGLHYFKVVGKELNDLRVRNPYLQISSMTRALYLWTEQGAVRHCKSINTTEAWDMFDELENNYFNRVVETSPVPTKTARRPLSPTACVYVLLLSNGTVKIGHTGNLRERVAKIKNCTGLKVDRLYFTLTISRDIARLIEWACQENFSSRKVGSEIFNADFNESCEVVNSFVKVVLDRNNELLKVADRMESSPERQAILITAANTFVGRILP